VAGPSQIDAIAALQQVASSLQVIADYVGTPVPTPTPTPTPTPAPAPAVDPYAKGTLYPPRPTVSIAGGQVLPGATRVNALVRIDHAAPATVHSRLRCFNGANGGKAHPDTTKPFFFRDGDPLEQTIPFDIYPMKEGQSIKLEMPNVPDAAKRGGGVEIVCSASAVPQPEIPFGGRAPMRFTPLGDLIYQATGKQILEGGLWLNRLAHGRTQPDNGETGYYDPNAFELDGDDLLLKAFRRDTPISVGDPATIFQFSSSVLTGLKQKPGEYPTVRDELSFKYGSIRWVAKMPTRIGTWPGLWLCSKKKPVPTIKVPLPNWFEAAWPFEIDGYEGFTYSTDYWRAQNSLSSAIHGGHEGSNKQTFAVGGSRLLATDLGLKATFASEFHSIAIKREPGWITTFADDIEVMRFVDPFDSTEGWYPIMDNAVKIASDQPFSDGNGNFAIREVSICRAE
jgi:hypothetical protein